MVALLLLLILLTISPLARGCFNAVLLAAVFAVILLALLYH